ncbi:hypothetical protein LTR91_017898 [Friedmanniomyces endolithicus]|uniref:Fatty acid desaturase domain-containing protein n=1 Tax=Friedmanniomyces endolithicus TaxID=329885 RepID=A0AAN6K4W6_9PEZI|nr:hypothetical protein LTR38_014738 [Friedmanniomyces endolithicus]KAK0803140.1 hypothetical protein LTR75_008084 [Friedmanniomyces endolithicus]KAK0809972.1 hypothetical protein LTR59_002374 [Friedmanniomyces endolithicus]KAK0846307.1 hypothetical protein LTR03_006960 [Friedmanniomyces endolithicus]KAK0862999.1 hypothetical protein LTS02_006805 [Friedmanniomyces endolithicus]
MGRSCLLTRSDVFALIADGGKIVIKDDAVLRLDGWLEKHPGGRLAILHMCETRPSGRARRGSQWTKEAQGTGAFEVGVDKAHGLMPGPMKPSDRMRADEQSKGLVYSSSHNITLTIDVCTSSHSADTLKGMNRFRIGTLTGEWSNFVPPIQGGIFSLREHENDPKAKVPDKIFNSESEKPVQGGALEVAAPPWTEKAFPPILLSSEKILSPDEYFAQAVQDDINASVQAYPSLDAATQGSIAKKYQELHERIKREGLYDCDYSRYGIEMLRYGALFAGFVYFLRAGWYGTSATFLGLFWQQIMFSAHDAGHRGITHNFVIDTLIGIFIGDFCCGLSIGWWKSSHNVHHLVTNQPEHDPDIQNIPLFATSPEFLKSLTSSYYNGFVFVYDAIADFTLRFQSYTYYPIMAAARFNLYFLSWAHLLKPSAPNMGRAFWTRPTEILAIFGYFFWFGYLVNTLCIPTWQDRVLFILVSHFATMPLHIQITLSHWGMPTCVLPGECFAQHQLRTTMDVDCPAWLDFVHGGLQFQAVHHLFPRMPRHNLRKTQPLVREFCKETGIKYSILSFKDGNVKVLSRLEEITKQAVLMAKCQAHMAATGESGLH